ncbi:MAG: phosphomethylpyrimidine synthase ThiC, partial [Candidatus Cloacimonetes bacterium]|nr:phosphomethylpyrimidine synthase ThiC [Candidatus Cloacimonadota bacterium]
ERSERVLGIVSRGGSLLKHWIEVTGNENPLYEDYDRLLDIAEKYDVTLSLGDGLRPGAQNDATDIGQISELLILGELVELANKRGVQVMVEGPGHIPLDEVEMNVKLQKKLCHNAPFYVLGPLVTDIAPGYDHITGAIGGALAASYGADFLCYVTPAEHLCLPDLEDVKQGVIASKLAAHCGDLVKRKQIAIQRDRAISEARRELNWERVFQFALDPLLAKKRKESTTETDSDYCSMCGSLCAIKIDKKATKPNA